MGTWIGIICLVFIYIYDVRHQTRKIRGIWWRTNCRGEGDNVASTRNYFIICICVFILVFSSIDNVVDIRNDVYWTPVEFEVWGTIVKLFHIVLRVWHVHLSRQTEDLYRLNENDNLFCRELISWTFTWDRNMELNMETVKF